MVRCKLCDRGADLYHADRLSRSSRAFWFGPLRCLGASSLLPACDGLRTPREAWSSKPTVETTRRHRAFKRSATGWLKVASVRSSSGVGRFDACRWLHVLQFSGRNHYDVSQAPGSWLTEGRVSWRSAAGRRHAHDIGSRRGNSDESGAKGSQSPFGR